MNGTTLPRLTLLAALLMALQLPFLVPGAVADSEGDDKSSASLSGFVLSAATDDRPSTPIANALVVAVRHNEAADPFGNPNRPIAMTTTDEDGAWSMPTVPVGNLVVSATAPGYLMATSERIHLDPDSDVSLTLYPAWAAVEADDNPGTLTGQVVRLAKPYGDDDDDEGDDDDEEIDDHGVVAASLLAHGDDDDDDSDHDDDRPTTVHVFLPVSGAYVTTFALPDSDPPFDIDGLPVSGQSRTDDDGRFAIHPLNPGLHLVVARTLLHRPTVAIADIASSQTTEATLLIVRAGDNPSTFPTVLWLKRDRPGDDHDAHWESEESTHFTSPLPGMRNGWLTLRSRGNHNTFGYWQTASGWLHRFPSSLYQVDFVVATDQPDPADSPGVRLRANSSSLQQTDLIRITSLGDAGLAPTMEGRTYDLFFEPMDTDAFLPRGLDRINLSFDILNFDPNDAPDGEVILKSFDIRVHSLALIETTANLATWNFDSGPEGWVAHENVPPFTPVAAEWADGALTLRVDHGGSSFGFWSSPDDGLAAPEAGTLIRAAFDVRSNQGDPSAVATLRVRLNAGDGQIAVAKVVPSLDEGHNSPDTDGRTYRVYFQIPPALAGQPLVFSIDLLGFDSDDADDNALSLDSVRVDAIQLPTQ